MYDERLKQSLPAVEERIERARERSGRHDAVRIVAVTKGHGPDAIRAATAAGLRDCGENRVPELEDKVETLGRDAAQWHLIGHLQRNKVKKALELFDVIHSIDSLRLARQLSDDAKAAGITVRGFVQVNASGEAAKGGIDVDDDVNASVDAVREIIELPHLRIDGLMTMAPFVADEPVLRTTFSRTRRLLERCHENIAGSIGKDLSMGMTNDFEIAVEEGATIVRLGTILFGERIK